MSLPAWNERLSVGVKEMDAQHQKLFGLLGQLTEAMSKGQGADVMKPILAGLLQYTQTHFKAEEVLMQRTQYPGYAKQKEQHEAFTVKVKELQAKLDKGQMMLSVETLNFLKTWLTDHIQGTDKQYGPHLNQHGIK